MDKVAFKMQVQDMLEAERPDVAAVLALVGEQLGEDAKSAVQAFAGLTEAVVRTKDFAGAIDCMAFFAQRSAELRGIELAQMREVVRRSANSTEEKLFVDAVGLDTAIATSIVSRLRVLTALTPGTYVNSSSWGFGVVKSLDTFYGKVIIDFNSRQNHAMTLAVAGQNLSVADEKHLMTRFTKDREGILALVQKHPAEIVRLALESYGPMSLQRLQDRLAETGIVPAADWKRFWESARKSLKSDKGRPVEIPQKRSEPLRLLEGEEDFGDRWLKAFSKQRDLKAIYEGALAIRAAKKEALPDSYRDVIAERLAFALKGAARTDWPRYAQVAALMRTMGLSTPEAQAVQAAKLLEEDEEDTLLAAFRGLPARDVKAVVAFLLEADPEKSAGHKQAILDRLPRYNGVALGAVLDALKGDEETGDRIRSLLASQGAPEPTLVVWALRNRAAAEAWKVPALNDLAKQAIYIIEQRLSGEELKMRNVLQGFFDSQKWIESLCDELSAEERQILFERIQASHAWDPSSQRTILVRMARRDPSLNALRRAVKAQQEVQHLTSRRSLAAFRLAYDHLINVEIPANSRDIATARSYGDLRENAEYQFARDHQRLLLSRQDEMDRTLRLVKPTDFAGVACDVAAMGTRVTVETPRGVATYTILGELDRDEALNIISCRSRLADALMGKKPGETVALPDERGTVEGVLKAVEPLDDAVKAWLAAIPAVYVPNA